jgi:hypothetical protein
MVGDFMGVKWTGDISLDTKLGIKKKVIPLETLVKVRALGDISREGFFEVINDQYGSELSAEVEAERLDMEGGGLDDLDGLDGLDGE